MELAIYPLYRAHEQHMSEVGGKAWRLGKAASAGLPVPDGLVVAHETLILAMDDNQIRERILERITDHFRGNDAVLAVRSSSSMEDVEAASGAGIFESVIGVRGADEIGRAFIRCLQALDTPAARRYIGRNSGRADAAWRMNLIVQQLIPARRSGIAITHRPRPGQLMAEGVWGLASDLVSGMVNPDFVVVRLEDGQVVTERRGKQGAVCVHDAAGRGIVRREPRAEEIGGAVFDRKVVSDLAALARHVGQVFETDQEMEWAEDTEGRVWLIQARPFANALSYRHIKP